MKLYSFALFLVTAGYFEQPFFLTIALHFKKRQTEAAPILSELGKWMIEQYTQVPPKSAIGVALAYSIKR